MRQVRTKVVGLQHCGLACRARAEERGSQSSSGNISKHCRANHGVPEVHSDGVTDIAWRRTSSSPVAPRALVSWTAGASK